MVCAPQIANRVKRDVNKCLAVVVLWIQRNALTRRLYVRAMVMMEFWLQDHSRQIMVVITVLTLALRCQNSVHETVYLMCSCPLAITAILPQVFAQPRVRVSLRRCVTPILFNALTALFLLVLHLVKVKQFLSIPAPCVQAVCLRFSVKMIPHVARPSHHFHRRFAHHNVHATDMGVAALLLQPTE